MKTMNTCYVIEDEIHAEQMSRHATINDAISELQRLALIPWDEKPNVAPCTNWKDCGRSYEIVEYDATNEPWREVRRISALEISDRGITWSDEMRPSLEMDSND